MKKFRSEFAHSYNTYSFGYCNYAVKEKGDELSSIYKEGYLPYTGKKGVLNTLYMARSARVNLEKFTPNSENRRILKIFDGQFEKTVTPKNNFNYKDEKFLNFWIEYFEKRHGPDVMPEERLLDILESEFSTHIVTYTKDGEGVAYVIIGQDEYMGHYWYSAYNLDLVFKSLGMWIMVDLARGAKEDGKKHFYLGTLYGDKAIYKTNLDSVEYWNGNKWLQDIKLLKERARSDSSRIIDIEDEWKEKL